MNNNIIDFLQSLGANIPENFETECDEALVLLADELSHSELVAPPAELNIEYPRKECPSTRNSISDSGEAFEDPEPMPIHRRVS